VPIAPQADERQPGGVAGHARVLLGDLDQAARPHRLPQAPEPIQVGRGRRLGEDRQPELDCGLHQARRRRPRHADHHEVRTLARHQLRERAVCGHVPLPGHLLGLVRAVPDEAGRLELRRDQAGQPQVELRSPAGADDAEPAWHRRHAGPARRRRWCRRRPSRPLSRRVCMPATISGALPKGGRRRRHPHREPGRRCRRPLPLVVDDQRGETPRRQPGIRSSRSASVRSTTCAAWHPRSGSWRSSRCHNARRPGGYWPPQTRPQAILATQS